MANEEEPTLNIIIPYTLVEDGEEFETMWRYYRFGNSIASFLCRRSVRTKVWEAVLEDGEPYPGTRNPGGLSGKWRLGSVKMTAPRGTRLQRTVREVWSMKSDWEFINE